MDGTGTPSARNRSKTALAVARNVDHSGRSTAVAHSSPGAECAAAKA
jgi:hypothetical protein